MRIVVEIQRMRRRSPKMTAMMRKRDTEGAFNRIPIRPDLSKLMITELDGNLLGLEENVTISHLAFPIRTDCHPVVLPTVRYRDSGVTRILGYG